MSRHSPIRALLLVAATVSPTTGQTPRPAELLTVAERSEYTATATYADVMQFCQQLASRSDAVSLAELGTSSEKRSLPLLILAQPSIRTATAAKRSQKLVVFAMGNIHAGEVCGKEALLMLARELGLAENHPLLEKLVVVFAPIYNADGNERFAVDNRPGQRGPKRGMGQRENAQGLDLNRDHIKLESPEARALARFLTTWSPAVAIDCHTTNGSYHRYALTYDGPRHPATPDPIIRYARDEFLPEVSRRLLEATGYRTFFYGNFDRPHQRWETYPALPRFSTHYFGLRNCIGILSEAYAYAPYRERVFATRDFVKQCLELCAAQQRRIGEVIQATKDEPRGAAKRVALRFEHAPLPTRYQVLGYVEQNADGKTVATQEPRDYDVEYLGLALPTHSVDRPYAYLIPPRYTDVVDNLGHHGIEVDIVREDIELDVEVHRIVRFRRAQRPFQGHRLLEIDTEIESRAQRITTGTRLVRTDQSLGSLVVNLLEPESQDGLATWNFFDDAVTIGNQFPVIRLPKSAPILTSRRSARSAEPHQKRPITFRTLYGERRVRFGGSPASGFGWTEDGQHYWQFKSGRPWKVTATSGRCEPLAYDPQAVRTALEQVPGIDDQTARQMVRGIYRRLDSERTAALLAHHNDLYYVTLDGDQALRLTDSAAAEELASFSPDGRSVAFVRDHDLYVIDLDSQRERRLTFDGDELVRNAKCDWVYYEEINRRNWRAYKWSPNSESLAFMQFNDEGVGTFRVVDHLPFQQTVETERYPLAGQPNPQVRVGVVRAKGGPIRWLGLEGYSPDDMLVRHFNWTPDSSVVYCYLQDRAQRWLDFHRFELVSGQETRLLRQRTEAWVDNPGDPWFLQDQSFLLFSEQDGWKHIYHHAADGRRIRQITTGDWEVRRIHAVNEDQGWLYFSGTCDSHIASNLYRIRFDGTGMSRLTSDSGSHRVTVNPQGTMFTDAVSSHTSPTQVRLFSVDGQLSRTLDINPVPALDEYRLCEVELLQIPARDGFLIEGTLIKPPNFNPQKEYPLWLMTYGGPHAPRISDSWMGGRPFDQLLAQMGIVAFTMDPRSASGKGARSTWQAYRQLGVLELRDIEDALEWVTAQPFVDASRIGMSGHSYGGFMTAYAMTHCNRFAAGIAGAPVTDWRNYDTIYTERYMDTPQENPEGYEKTSVVAAAKNLHGRLLLIHGARDDNVHVANTLQLARALQRADKPFEMMIYPSHRHGISGEHYRRLMVDFIRRTMLE